MKLAAAVTTPQSVYTAMSDVDLDAVYSAAFKAGDSPTYTAAGLEILYRLNTPVSAFESLFGYHKFPLYDAIQASGQTTANFVASDVAQQAVVTQSGNIVNAAANLGKKSLYIAAGIIGVALLVRFGRR